MRRYRIIESCANAQLSWGVAFICAYLHACGMTKQRVGLQRTWSLRLISLVHMSVCMHCFLLAPSWPEGQTDATNTNRCPSRIGPLHERKKHVLCDQGRPLHHFTSAVAATMPPPLPCRGFWPQLSNHLGIHRSLLWLYVQWHCTL